MKGNNLNVYTLRVLSLANCALFFAQVMFGIMPCIGNAQEKNGFFDQGYVTNILEDKKEAQSTPKEKEEKGKNSPSTAGQPQQKRDNSEAFHLEQSEPEKERDLFSNDPVAAEAEKDAARKIISIGAALEGTNPGNLKQNLKVLMALLDYHKLEMGELYIVGDTESIYKTLHESFPEKIFNNVFSEDPRTMSKEAFEKKVAMIQEQVMSDPWFLRAQKIMDNLHILSTPPQDINGVEITRSPSWIIETAKEKILLEGMLNPGRCISAKGYFVAPEGSDAS